MTRKFYLFYDKEYVVENYSNEYIKVYFFDYDRNKKSKVVKIDLIGFDKQYTIKEFRRLIRYKVDGVMCNFVIDDLLSSNKMFFKKER